MFVRNRKRKEEKKTSRDNFPYLGTFPQGYQGATSSAKKRQIPNATQDREREREREKRRFDRSMRFWLAVGSTPTVVLGGW